MALTHVGTPVDKGCEVFGGLCRGNRQDGRSGKVGHGARLLEIENRPAGALSMGKNANAKACACESLAIQALARPSPNPLPRDLRSSHRVQSFHSTFSNEDRRSDMPNESLEVVHSVAILVYGTDESPKDESESNHGGFKAESRQ